jgi:hypothetical protein
MRKKTTKKKDLKRYELTQTIREVYIIKATSKEEALDNFYAGVNTSITQSIGPGDTEIDIVLLDADDSDLAKLD